MSNSTSRVNSNSVNGSGLPPEQPPKNDSKKWNDRFVKKINSLCESSATTVKVVRRAGGIVKLYCPLPYGVKLGLQSTKFFTILNTNVTLKKLWDHIKGLIHGDGAWNRIKSGLSVVVDCDDLTASVSSTTEILVTATLLSEKYGKWIPFFELASFFVGFISIGLKVDSVVNMRRLDLKFADAAKSISENPCDVTEIVKVLTLIKDLKFASLKGEKKTSLQTKLSVSKKADLTGRVNRLLTLLKSEKVESPSDLKNATNEAAQVVKNFASQVHMQLRYEQGELANKVATSIGLFCVIFTPFALCGAVVLFSTAAVSFVLMAGRAMCIHKNPFDEFSRSRGEALLDCLIPSRKEAIQWKKKAQEKEKELVKKEEELTKKVAEVAKQSSDDLKKKIAEMIIEKENALRDQENKLSSEKEAALRQRDQRIEELSVLSRNIDNMIADGADISYLKVKQQVL